MEPTQHDETVGEKDTVARLDKAGYPLAPQPTSHRDDPLVRIRQHVRIKQMLTAVTELVSHVQTTCHSTDKLACHARAYELGCGQPSFCDDGKGVQDDPEGHQLR